jgi:rod shape-determining protein MreD
VKKIFCTIGIIITFFILYFLQANFFTWFTISGVMPNLFVIFILFIGLFIGKKVGVVLGLFIGVYIDLLIGKAIGITGLMLAIIGLAAEYIDKNFSKDSRLTLMFIVAGGTAIYEIGIYAFQILKWNAMLEIVPFLKILVVEVIYNMVLVIILYPFIQKVGSHLESLFKNKAVLTRYF